MQDMTEQTLLDFSANGWMLQIQCIYTTKQQQDEPLPFNLNNMTKIDEWVKYN